MKRSFEGKVSEFDPSVYWANHNTQPSVIAYRAREDSRQKQASNRVYNTYEGHKSARQLSETVPEFLARLPPYSSHITDCGPWIFISNPSYDPNKTREDIRLYKVEGAQLLSTFQDQQTALQDPTKQTRKLNALRKQLQDDIFSLAKQSKLTAGKWMLFRAPADINRIWALVATAVASGELGHAAKVASDDGSGDSKSRLICIYSEDFSDREDVKRVLLALRRMGLVTGDRGIYYKTDAFTWLEINGGNQWGLKASLYASKDVLKESWGT